MSLAFLTGRLWPFRWALALSLALMLAESAAVLAVPWLGGQIVGGLFDATDPAIGVLTPALVVLCALPEIEHIVQRRVVAKTSNTVTAGLPSLMLADRIPRLLDRQIEYQKSSVVARCA